MDRERRTVKVSYDSPVGSLVLDQMGRVIGQVIGCEQLDDGWQIQMDVEVGADLAAMQILASYGVTGSING